MTDDERYEAGMKVRRKVLGDAYVDASLAKRSAFNTEFQEQITRNILGSIWTRPGLDLKTRSCIVLAITIALGHWDEFRLHVKAAFNNGLGRDEIKEVILQATAYCGAPAGNHAMAEAEAVFAREKL